MNYDYGVYGSGHTKQVLEIIRSLDSHPSVGRVIYHEDLSKDMGVKGYTTEEMQEEELDFMITIGGDGTILKLLQEGDFNILGINTGRVGFLTAVEFAQLDKALLNMEQEDFFIDERVRLKVELNGEDVGVCTNEAVVHTDRVAKIRSFEIFHGDKLVDRFRADGVIVATPTGSTCYSMSAGGPIVDPCLDAFLLVPLSPYKLATKPYLVPTDDDIRISLMEKGKNCMMVLDGQKDFMVNDKDDIVFKKADVAAKFVRFEDDFYKRIRKKLVWK